MKKFMLTGLLVCALLFVTACRGDSDTQDTGAQTAPQGQETQTSQPEDPPSQGQNETTSGTDTSIATPSTSGSYYTFGDTINLWDEWEIVFVDNVTIANTTRPPRANDSERIQLLQEGEVVRIPTILTNITDINRPQGLPREYTVYGPSGELQITDDLRSLSGLMFDPEIDRVPGIHQPADAGEVIEGYVFLIYDGNGDYWIHWPDRLGGMQVRIPVSR